MFAKILECGAGPSHGYIIQVAEDRSARSILPDFPVATRALMALAPWIRARTQLTHVFSIVYVAGLNRERVPRQKLSLYSNWVGFEQPPPNANLQRELRRLPPKKGVCNAGAAAPP